MSVTGLSSGDVPSVSNIMIRRYIILAVILMCGWPLRAQEAALAPEGQTDFDKMLKPTPNDKPKATVRMQLEAHATNVTCASWHRKIDPLGLAFDNYDAIGRWRTEEVVPNGKGANPAVNASGTLPDGRAYSGPEEFKQLLAQDVDRFADAFIEQLATFALRRVMTVDDAAQMKSIAQASKNGDYRLRAVMENLVMSELFQKR